MGDLLQLDRVVGLGLALDGLVPGVRDEDVGGEEVGLLVEVLLLLCQHFPRGLEPPALHILIDVVSRRGFLEAYKRVDVLALGVIDAGDKARESTELKGPIGEGDLLAPSSTGAGGWAPCSGTC